MKLKHLILTTLLGVAAMAMGQGSVTLAPNYKVGDTDRYKMTMEIKGQMAMTMTMTIVEKVAKVYPNGDADLVATPSGGTMMMNGQSHAIPQTPAQTVRVNKFGQPVKGKAANAMGGMGFDPMSMNSMLPHRPLKAGETFPIHQDGKNGTKVDGSMKVLAVAGGVAKLQMNTTMTSAQTGSMKMAMVVLMRTSDSKMNKMDGTISGMMGQPGMTAHITMVRE